MTYKGYHSGIISGIAEFNGEIIEKNGEKTSKLQFDKQYFNLRLSVVQLRTVSYMTSDCQ